METEFQPNLSSTISVIPNPEDERTGLVLGDYRILRRIGSGAMADVYLARQNSLDREVALKILKPEYAADEMGVRRFVREAQAAAKLEHPNIVHIYEVGTRKMGTGLPFLRRIVRLLLLQKKSSHEGILVHFIAQEYVPGLNLQQYLRRCIEPLSIRQTLSILQKICSALEKARQYGIVHRDVKPENILLCKDGSVKITDFGLAYLDNLYGSRSMSLTQAGLTLGTPLYMSPEQAEGKTVDFRSDIYSLGVTAWQMLTGYPPYNGQTLLSVILQHLNQPVPPVHLVRHDVPVVLSDIIVRMMAKCPEERYSSFKEISENFKTISKTLVAQQVKSIQLNAVKEQTETEKQKEQTEKKEQTETEKLAEVEEQKKDDLGNNISVMVLPVTSTVSEHQKNIENQDRLFTDSEEEQKFNDTLQENAVSMYLQASFSRLQTLSNKEKLSSLKSQRRKRFLISVIVTALLAGGLVGFYRQRSYPMVAPVPNVISPISRFETVEEQWVFASQMETIEGWKSVIEFFPEKEYWKRRAQQQLARTYIKEGNINGARDIFLDFTEMSPPVQHYLDFGTAGLACCMAMDGHPDVASSIISTMRSKQKVGYDRLTEDIITTTQEYIRRRSSIWPK